jgi:DNA mismatch repair protein MutS
MGRDSPLIEALSSMEPDMLTPREALQALYRLKALAEPNGLPPAEGKTA